MQKERETSIVKRFSSSVETIFESTFDSNEMLIDFYGDHSYCEARHTRTSLFVFFAALEALVVSLFSVKIDAFERAGEFYGCLSFTMRSPPSCFQCFVSTAEHGCYKYIKSALFSHKMINYVNGLGRCDVIGLERQFNSANLEREMPAKAFYDHFVAPSAGEHSLSAGSVN
jgi:hypothetical protein